MSTVSSQEGGLQAPLRRPLGWQDPEYYDPQALDAELRRVFDICHGCRRCFNLCDSFPRLFDLVDDSPTGELDSVGSAAFAPVVEACTLCDLCFMTKCPYVPPHPDDLDFPHLMLRARANDFVEKGVPLRISILTDTDTLGKIATAVAPVANWSTATSNKLTRPLMQLALDVDARADLPKFCGKTFQAQAQEITQEFSEDSLWSEAWAQEKVVLYATCYGNYNNPAIGVAALRVLRHQGAQVEVAYEGCCGMPKLEHGDIADVAQRAERIAKALMPWIDKGYTIVPLVPSCSLMMQLEWPLILPDNPMILRLREHVRDLSVYFVTKGQSHGLRPGLMPLTGQEDAAPAKALIQMACHARALNAGPKGADMLTFIPQLVTTKVERCSGHGGSWGMMTENFDIALKVGKPVAQKVVQDRPDYVLSECPLAATHIAQGAHSLEGDAPQPFAVAHPIELIAASYGLPLGVPA